MPSSPHSHTAHARRQGEGGCTPSQVAFLSGLRDLCDEAGALLVFDEVQCGLGRTGKLWGYEHYGVEPDIMSLAKPLAGGLPIGAVLMKQKVADVMKPGGWGHEGRAGAWTMGERVPGQGYMSLLWHGYGACLMKRA